MKSSHPFRTPLLTVAEWLITLPAALLLVAAALRLLQPRQYEPARTAWAVFAWASVHISRLGAGILFLALPALAIAIGCGTLLRAWRSDPVFRQDVALAWDTFRRQIAMVLLTAGTLLAASIFALALLHMITD